MCINMRREDFPLPVVIFLETKQLHNDHLSMIQVVLCDVDAKLVGSVNQARSTNRNVVG